MESGRNVWVWLVGVVSKRWVWLVGVGVIYGCGCKEVYRFSHTTYPYSSCIYLFFFAAASLLFVHFLLERRRMPYHAFYFARRVRKLALYSDVIYLFDWKSAVEHDGCV